MPPEDKICFFRGLKNAIVIPAVGMSYGPENVPYNKAPVLGDRSLASCLSEDNVDG
jgi:hypothetical protein